MTRSKSLTRALLPLLLLAWSASSCAVFQAPDGPLAPGPFYGDRYALSVRALAYEDYEQTDQGLGDDSEHGETDVEGWGLEAEVVGSKRPVLVFGWTQREYGNNEEADADEVHGGFKFYLGDDRVVPYGIVLARYSEGLRFRPAQGAPPAESEGYFGVAAGFGAVVLVDSSFFLDFRVQYEDTLDEIELTGGSEVGLSGWVGSIGAGFSF